MVVISVLEELEEVSVEKVDMVVPVWEVASAVVKEVVLEAPVD